VRYIDPEADAAKKGEKGWLDRLAFWRSSKSGVDTQAQYRIHVAGEGSEARVRVLTREGGTDASATAQRILGLLHEQLK